MMYRPFWTRAFISAAAFTVLFAQENAKKVAPSAHVLNANVDQKHRVTIQIEVSAGTTALVMPACEPLPEGSESPCWIEVQAAAAQGWHVVQPKYAKQGMEPMERWTARTILPGGSHDFTYRFIRDEWEVSRGQRIRIVVGAWRDERSMRKEENGFRLKTQAFACP